MHLDPETRELKGVWADERPAYSDPRASQIGREVMQSRMPGVVWDEWMDYLDYRRPTDVWWAVAEVKASNAEDALKELTEQDVEGSGR